MAPSLLRKSLEIGIYERDDKSFAAYINPINMQIYSEISLTSWTERYFESTEVICSWKKLANLFSHFL